MSTIAVIPARYGSTRFPGKPLADICGKPLIAHVIDRAREAATVDEVVVATDDGRIVEAVKACDARAVMTSPHCPSGTDRIAEAIEDYPDATIILNLQGDEPLMSPEVIDQTVTALSVDMDSAVATAMIPITCREDFESPHVVKVVCDQEGRALYFSRAPIPCLIRAEDADLARFNPGDAGFWGYKHFGLYVYRREPLLEFVDLEPSRLECTEKLEQLRFLENGMQIRVVQVEVDSIGVDTPEDLEKVRAIMKKRQ
ncbi:MAG: 3-deoxy-manno-octulosonate cytidylyltransferase [Candidatus Sumerlaeia bacterium]